MNLLASSANNAGSGSASINANGGTITAASFANSNFERDNATGGIIMNMAAGDVATAPMPGLSGASAYRVSVRANVMENGKSFDVQVWNGGDFISSRSIADLSHYELDFTAPASTSGLILRVQSSSGGQFVTRYLKVEKV